MSTHITWRVSPADWRAFVARCPHTTFFHTPEWYQAQASANGYRLETAHFAFEDGREALLPLASRTAFRGLARVAYAGVENGYGGLVAPSPLSAEQASEAYRLVRARFADLQVIGNPHDRGMALPADWECEQDVTQVLPILDREAQFKLMNATRSKRVRRAQRNGFELEIRQGPCEADAGLIYPLYAEHAAQWRYTKWLRDEAYFRALFRHAGEHLVLAIARHEGKLAGFRLVGCYGPAVMDLHLSTAKDYEALDVGPHLVTEPLVWLHEHGYKTFDFLPSGQLEGVRLYKESFGAQPLGFTRASHQGLVTRSLAALWRVAHRPAPMVPAG